VACGPGLKSKGTSRIFHLKTERILPVRAPFATGPCGITSTRHASRRERGLLPDEVYALTAYLLLR